MALMLREGDYVPDGSGGLQTVSGAAELLERVLWKLSVRRGSFPLLPNLGSRLHLLGRVRPGQREMMARQYVAEALEDEDLTVREVRLDCSEKPRLRAELLWHGTRLNAELELGGIQ